MTKSREDLLLTAVERVETALDNLVEVACRVSRSRRTASTVSDPGYAASVPDRLRQKLGRAEAAFGTAFSQLYDAEPPVPLAMPGMTSVGSKASDGYPLPSR